MASTLVSDVEKLFSLKAKFAIADSETGVLVKDRVICFNKSTEDVVYVGFEPTNMVAEIPKGCAFCLYVKALTDGDGVVTEEQQTEILEVCNGVYEAVLADSNTTPREVKSTKKGGKVVKVVKPAKCKYKVGATYYHSAEYPDLDVKVTGLDDLLKLEKKLEESKDATKVALAGAVEKFLNYLR